MFASNAPAPTAVLFVPVVFDCNALNPIATLLLAVHDSSAASPIATLLDSVVTDPKVL